MREFEAQAASLRLPDGDARQLRADMAAVKVQTGLLTPDHYTIAGHFNRRVRSSNTPQTEQPPPDSLICSGACIFERTKRLIATRVHDRARGAGLGLTPTPATRKIQTGQQSGNADRLRTRIGSGHLTAAHSGA